MRDYLFRGKPKNKGDYYFFSQIWKDSCKDGFVYGSLVISKNKDSGDRYYICTTALCSINSCVNNGTTSMIEVIPETVGQYIDLTDKKNIRIFEGDIIAFSDRITKVFYNENCGSWDCKYIKNIDGTPTKHEERSPSKWKHNSEVIGNIHDNPELLSLS